MTTARTSRRPALGQRIANRLLGRMIRRGKGPDFLWLMTVRGRRTGEPYTTPVAPVRVDGETWLVSPYGDVSWVLNVRAESRVVLRRGGQSTGYRARELGSTDAVPVLRTYLSMPSAKFVRKDFDITAGSPDRDIADEAPRHPVFALTPEP